MKQHSWIPGRSSWETATAAALIAGELEFLKEKRMPLNLTGKDYRSATTVLLDHGPAGLVIHRPADLPSGTAVIRCHFRDPANLSCYFDVQVLGWQEELLFTSIPRQLKRLQRRAHYRVEIPEDSRASFFCKGELNDGLAVKNLSIGGMLCCGPKRLAEGAILTTISLTLPGYTDPQQSIQITIPQGVVARCFVDQKTGSACHGVAFKHGKNEEAALLRYVRQQELQLARAASRL